MGKTETWVIKGDKGEYNKISRLVPTSPDQFHSFFEILGKFVFFAAIFQTIRLKPYVTSFRSHIKVLAVCFLNLFSQKNIWLWNFK